MATIVNNPAPAESNTGSSGFGFLLGAILLVVFLFVLISYLLPALRSGMTAGGGTSVTVPDKINVNVQDGTK